MTEHIYSGCQFILQQSVIRIFDFSVKLFCTRRAKIISVISIISILSFRKNIQMPVRGITLIVSIESILFYLNPKEYEHTKRGTITVI